MRLLQFTSDAGGANPRHPSTVAEASASAERTTRNDPRPGEYTSTSGGHRSPMEEPPLGKPVQRIPVDLKGLQARISALEQRVHRQTGRITRRARMADLERLQLRVQRIEQTLNSELWAAHQREYTLLEMLSKPPLKKVASERIKQLWRSEIPAVSRWLHQSIKCCWLELRHVWWPTLVAAWQESLDKARR